MNVSVVLCTYTLDMYDHFCEAAESVLNQTYNNVELVVIVDGTPDVYDKILEDYDNHEDMIISCNDENVGLLQSRNRGAELATGDVVAFIDDDAIADEEWIERLVDAYENQNAIAAGGKMTPEWIAGKPSFLPEEFYWLIGVTHRGFADGAGEVRNTFGSNISFRADLFEEIGGFGVEVCGRKGDSNLQGGETELCVRIANRYGQGVWYEPKAEIAHKVFDYRTDFFWLLDRSFWQGYSKHTMNQFVEEETDQESEFLWRLILEFGPQRIWSLLRAPSWTKVNQLVVLVLFTLAVGAGFLYGALRH